MKIDRNTTNDLLELSNKKLTADEDQENGAILNKASFMDLENSSPINTNNTEPPHKKGRNNILNNNEVLTPVETTTHAPNYRVDMKLKSPSPTEDDYIKSDKVHTHHGRVTHYYRDEAKHDMLLAVKVMAAKLRQTYSVFKELTDDHFPSLFSPHCLPKF